MKLNIPINILNKITRTECQGIMCEHESSANSISLLETQANTFVISVHLEQVQVKSDVRSAV